MPLNGIHKHFSHVAKNGFVQEAKRQKAGVPGAAKLRVPTLAESIFGQVLDAEGRLVLQRVLEDKEDLGEVVLGCFRQKWLPARLLKSLVAVLGSEEEVKESEAGQAV